MGVRDLVGRLVPTGLFSDDGEAEPSPSAVQGDGTGDPEPGGRHSQAPAERPGAADPSDEAEPVADDDRVLRLLVRNDGYVREATLLEETEWSQSTVDRVLKEMEDSDQITRVTRGRTTLVCRKGFEPDGHRQLFRAR